ncbi:site-specific integrase [Thermodesulfobacteriota bacterium]
MDRLLAECQSQTHLHYIVTCALNTGLRKGDILNLKWEQIRNGFIYPDRDTATKKRREIPINEDLAGIFKEIRKKQGLTSKDVFTYHTRVIQRVDRAFRGTLRRAGIEHFRFHDLRHTFASHLIMRGASLKEVQELLGHKTMTMTLRYAHLSQEHKKKAVSLLNGLIGLVKNNMSQNCNNYKSSNLMASKSLKSQ